MLFSRHAFTSSTAIAASSALFASTFIAAATSKASTSTASANGEGNVDAGILALSHSSSRVGENRLQGIFGEERALQGLCSAGYVECYKGKLASDNSTDCGAACVDVGSGGYGCCIGKDACILFTGKICKDGSCYGPSACRYATIPLVVNSCKGDHACDHVGYADVVTPANKVGNFIGSCNANKACYEIARYVEGGSTGNIENSCNFYLACAALGQVKNAGGPVTSNLKDCCNGSEKACYEYIEAMIPAECKLVETLLITQTQTEASTLASTTLRPGAGKNKKAGKTSKPTPIPTHLGFEGLLILSIVFAYFTVRAIPSILRFYLGRLRHERIL